MRPHEAQEWGRRLAMFFLFMPWPIEGEFSQRFYKAIVRHPLEVGLDFLGLYDRVVEEMVFEAGESVRQELQQNALPVEKN